MSTTDKEPGAACAHPRPVGAPRDPGPGGPPGRIRRRFPEGARPATPADVREAVGPAR
ncbi:hypothetical protein [Streptomyces sp. NPDC017940]|uniref:hypothetical protein n=1 Tax=Streptomyces sp. NPDC017940 TaxID=3365017 RepID=UPI0037A0710D